MTKRNYSRIFVDPDFKRRLKVESANNNMSIINYTRILANKEDFFKNQKQQLYTHKRKTKGGLFDMGF